MFGGGWFHGGSYSRRLRPALCAAWTETQIMRTMIRSLLHMRLLSERWRRCRLVAALSYSKCCTLTLLTQTSLSGTTFQSQPACFSNLQAATADIDSAKFTELNKRLTVLLVNGKQGHCQGRDTLLLSFTPLWIDKLDATVFQAFHLIDASPAGAHVCFYLILPCRSNLLINRKYQQD